MSDTETFEPINGRLVPMQVVSDYADAQKFEQVIEKDRIVWAFVCIAFDGGQWKLSRFPLHDLLETSRSSSSLPQRRQRCSKIS